MLERRTVRRLAVAMALGFLLVTWTAAAAGQEAPDDASYRVYVSNEYGGTVSVIDAETDEVIDTIRVSEQGTNVRPRGTVVSPDGRTIYVGISDFNPRVESDQDKIVAIDVKTNKVINTFYAGSDPERLAVSPDGTQLWASNEDVARATGYNLETGEVLGTFATGIEPEGWPSAPTVAGSTSPVRRAIP